MKKNKEQIIGSIPAIIRNDEGLYEGNLRHYFKVLFAHAKNLQHPYHNFKHTAHFLWLCWDALRFYQGHGTIGTGRERRNLMIAAIFHDFNHTGISGADSINIERATTALEAYCHPDDREFLPAIKNLIVLSEYPHTISSERVDIFAQIMRDADLAQALSSSWIQQVVFGLAREKEIAPLEMLKMQKDFIGGLHFHTQWAQETFSQEVLEEKMKEIEGLVGLLTE